MSLANNRLRLNDLGYLSTDDRLNGNDSGDLNTKVVRYSNGQKRLDAKRSGFQMPFEYWIVQPFEYWTHGHHLDFLCTAGYSNGRSST